MKGKTDIMGLFNAMGIEEEVIEAPVEGGELKKAREEIVGEHGRLETEQERKLNKDVLFKITEATRETALLIDLIPKAYRNVEFEPEKVKTNYSEQLKNSRRHELINFNDYISKTTEILSLIRARQDLPGSYIIGAPNGLGKTSFVYTAILLMYQRSMKVVPYLSLTELAEIKLANEKRLASGLKLVSDDFIIDGHELKFTKNRNAVMSYYADIGDAGYSKIPEISLGRYSWSEYINADVLFCYLTDPSTKELESSILKVILETRGTKGLPTVVMVSTSLNPYRNHRILGKNIWQEILSYSDTPKYDRLTHTSCFRINMD